MGNNKISIVTHEYPPIIGGAGIYASDLVSELKKNKISVLLYKSSINIKYNNPLIIYLKNILSVIISIKNFIIINFRTPDTILFNDSREKNIFLLLYSLCSKNIIKKSIFIMHGNEINTFYNNPSRLYRLLNLKNKFVQSLNDINKIIVVSSNEYKIWTSYFPELKDKIVIIPHGVSNEIFFPYNEELKKKIKEKLFNKDHFILLSVSRLVKEKGQDTILKALNYAFKNEPLYKSKIQLIIAGVGENEKDLRDYVKSNDLEENVFFYGKAARENLIDLYNISDLFILPSRYAESFGLVYIEALACKLPAISSDLGGVNDIIIDNYNGFKVDPTNYKILSEKIIELYNDQSKLLKMKDNSYDLYNKKYNIEITSKLFINKILK